MLIRAMAMMGAAWLDGPIRIGVDAMKPEAGGKVNTYGYAFWVKLAPARQRRSYGTKNSPIVGALAAAPGGLGRLSSIMTVCSMLSC